MASGSDAAAQAAQLVLLESDFSKMPEVNRWWEEMLPLQGKPAKDDILLGREADPQGVLRSIDEYAEQVRVSAETDFFRWPFPFSPELKRYNLDSGDSFDKQIAFLKEYLSLRLDALDAFFPGE